VNSEDHKFLEEQINVREELIARLKARIAELEQAKEQRAAFLTTLLWRLQRSFSIDPAREIRHIQELILIQLGDNLGDNPNNLPPIMSSGDPVTTGIAVRRDYVVGGGYFPDLSKFGPHESE